MRLHRRMSVLIGTLMVLGVSLLPATRAHAGTLGSWLWELNSQTTTSEDSSGTETGSESLEETSSPEGTENPFGLMFGGVNQTLLQVADSLGASYIRSRVFVDNWDGTCAGCKPFLAEGKGLVLTARFDGSDTTASGAPTDLGAYEGQLRTILEALRPDLVAVENEPDARVFYSGTPTQYLSTLKVACRVAHDLGTLCTDGGLANPTIMLVVYQHYLDTGRSAQADSYARRVLTEREYKALVNPANADIVESKVRRARAFIDGFRAAGADYVNFHWYRDDAPAFAETVQVLEELTGLPATSNEIGQYHDDPAVINGIMNEVIALGLDYAIWFNLDYTVPNGNTIRALHNQDGSLRLHGQAYRTVVDSLK